MQIPFLAPLESFCSIHSYANISAAAYEIHLNQYLVPDSGQEQKLTGV